MIEQACAEIAQKALDRQYFFGLLVGWLSCLIGWSMFNIPEFFSRKIKMIGQMQSLIERRNGIVTVTDLVVSAKVSPEKATKFLADFARKLEIEPEVEEDTGTKFYRFINAQEIAKRETVRASLPVR